MTGRTTELIFPEGTFKFKIENGKACLTEGSTRISVLAVPSQAEGIPVTEIEKKAFFGQRNLKQVILPESIETIGDWAFASCRNLESVEFLGKHTVLGKDVFQKCQKLQKIRIKEQEEDISWMLGAVPLHFPERYLMDVKEAGSEEWIANWDAGLMTRLRESDAEGFAEQFICGLENFGQKDRDSYQEERRMEKTELIYLRLLHPYGLDPQKEEVFRTYLKEHCKGCDSEAAWKVLLECHGTQMDYAKLYMEVYNEDGNGDKDALLRDIGDDFPELKAFILRTGETALSDFGFFEGLSLDF